MLLLWILSFGFIYAAALAWIMERPERKYHAARVEPQNVWIIAAGAFALITFFSTTVGAFYLETLFKAQLLLVCGLGVYFLVIEHKYRQMADNQYANDSAVMGKCFAIIKQEPKNIYARQKLVEIYEARGDYANAVSVMREMAGIENSVQHSWKLKELEDALAVSGKTLHERAAIRKNEQNCAEDETVIGKCNDVIRREPDNVYARHKLVDVYEARKDYAQAAAVMREVIKFEPSVQNSWKLKELEEQSQDTVRAR